MYYHERENITKEMKKKIQKSTEHIEEIFK